MKHLIVFADPNPKGFCRDIVTTLYDTLRAAEKEVIVRDLYELKLDPVLSEADMLLISKGDFMADVKYEQDLIQSASIVIFVYPVWWLGPPAILKGYFDRVFSKGFAYSYGKQGLERGLQGKRAAVINTMGAKTESYENSGMIDAMNRMIDVGVLEYVGFEIVDHIYLDKISGISDKQKNEYLKEIKCLSEKISLAGISTGADNW